LESDHNLKIDVNTWTCQPVFVCHITIKTNWQHCYYIWKSAVASHGLSFFASQLQLFIGCFPARNC